MRVFLASPRDLTDTRARVQAVADRLNGVYQSEPGSAGFLEVVDWHRHTLDIDTDAPPADPHDVFVGLAWLRFDRNVNDSETDVRRAATERDFKLAWKCWRQARRPQPVFARALRTPATLGDVDGLELARIEQFFARFDEDDDWPRVFTFVDDRELEEHLEGLLVERLETQGLVATSAAEPTEPSEVSRTAVVAAVVGEDEADTAPEFTHRLSPGTAYEVSFLSIEIAKFDQLSTTATPPHIATVRSSVRRLVADTAATYGGEVFSWDASGGLILFWRKRSYDHAIMTGLKVLHALPVFNLDPVQNPTGTDIRLRVAAHDAVIVFRLPLAEIGSPEIHFVNELQRTQTQPGELTISKSMLDKSDKRLRSRFKPKGRFLQEPIFACQLPASGGQPQRSNLEDLLDQVRERADTAESLLQALASAPEAASPEALSTAIDELYGALGNMASRFSRIDRNWNAEFFSQLADAARAASEIEATLWRHLRQRHAEARVSPAASSRLEAVVKAASRRRSRPVVILDKLEQRCRSLASGRSEPRVPAAEIDDTLLKKVETLIRADDLDNETALTDLLLNHRDGFLAYIVGRTDSDERHPRLIRKLWETADLVLLDDIYSIREHKRATDVKIFDALTDQAVQDRRFGVIRELLASTERPDEANLRRAFQRHRVEAGEEDLQIAWRCLVLGHHSSDIRSQAAMSLTPFSMWQAISHPSIPIPSIHAIGERLEKMGDEDAQKIFFDCIRARLEAAVEKAHDRDELEPIVNLVLLLLNLRFLVETGYFERFDDILGRLLEKTQAAGMEVAFFENLRRTLDQAHQEAGDEPAKPPQGVKRLPLTIQRRLAGEMQYLFWFLTHPDPRVAGETTRNIGLGNIERVLRLKETNGTVFLQLLRKPELFTRSQAVFMALNHPKCDQQFASRYITSMSKSRGGRQALEKVARNSSANPAIRGMAKRALSSGAKVGARR